MATTNRYGTGWYSTYFYNGRIYTAYKIRYSWTGMWALKNSGGINGVVSVACMWLPTIPLRAACTAAVNAYYWTIRTKVDNAIVHRKCLLQTIPAPPLPNLFFWTMSEVTCTA